jgi:hypothetical protein
MKYLVYVILLLYMELVLLYCVCYCDFIIIHRTCVKYLQDGCKYNLITEIILHRKKYQRTYKMQIDTSID